MLVNRDAPQDLKEPCARRPARPAVFLNLTEMLKWALAWGYSGEDCRAKSDAQGAWIGNPPK